MAKLCCPDNLSSGGYHLTSCMSWPWQVQDARAAQCTAEAIAAACHRELSQVSSNLAAQLEAESMWQGRAQGLQQQLDQAMQDKQKLQQDMAAAQAAVSDQQQSIGCVCFAVGIVVTVCNQHPGFLNFAKHTTPSPRGA